MLLSTSTGSIAKRLGLLEALAAIKNAGFDAYDFSLRPLTSQPDSPLMREDYLDFLREVKQTADTLGLVCNQAHATFPPEKYGNEEYNQATFARIIREIEAAAFVGAPIIVVHAVKPLPKDVDPIAENLRFYRSLIPYCEKYNIKIAVENLFELDELRDRRKPCCIGTSDKLAAFVDLLDSDWFTVCLDVGHAAINVEDPQDAIRTLGKRISCVHIHDNDFVNDRHTLPYLGKADWDEVCKAFAEVGYEGYFTAETGTFEGSFPAELIPAALQLEVTLFRHLAEIIESYR